MKRLSAFAIVLGLLCFSGSVFAVDLTVSGSGTYVVSSNATYNLVTVNQSGSLVVTNGATLTVTGALVGSDNASFLFDNCTVNGRINVQSSRKFHALNATLNNFEAAPTNSMVTSNSIIISSSTIVADGPRAPYYTRGGSAQIQLNSPNDIYISNSNISVLGGEGTSGYYGPQPDGSGTFNIQSSKDVYVENSTLASTGYPSSLSLSGNLIYAFNSNLSGNGTTGGSGTVAINGQELNGSGGSVRGTGGAGLSVAIHGGTIYAFPTGGGSGNISLSGQVVNWANASMIATGGNGGGGYSSYVQTAGGGSALITVSSTVNASPSLYSVTFGLTGGTGSSTGSTSLNITPSSINGALRSTVEIPRLVLDQFDDRNLWSPNSTLGWWDIDGTLVYQHALIDYYSRRSIKSMRTDFNKNGLAWSLFGGFLASVNPNRNFTGFNTVRLWVRGNADLLVKLRDGNFTEENVSTQNMSDAASEITHLDFNYSALRSVNLSNVDNVLLFAAPGDATASGTFYIDSVELTNTMRVEDFEDGNLWSPDSTLGWWDGDGTLVYQRNLVSSPRHEGASCMRVDFNKSGRPWSYFAGYIAMANPEHDFRAYRKLSFWVYGNVSLLVKLRDRGYHESDVATVSGVAGQWSLIEVDFSDLAIDKSDIDNIIFFAAPGSGTASGAFYIDDLKLIK